MNRTDPGRLPKEISSEAFEKLLQRLSPDRATAGERYEEMRWKLVKFFECNLCALPEDLADQALDRLIYRLSHEEIQEIATFVWGIARNLVQEARRRARKTISLSELPGEPYESGQSGHLIDDEIAGAEMTSILRECLEQVPPEEKEVFLSYYRMNGSASPERNRLARKLGINLGALRVRVNRLRNKLEKCVQRAMKGTRKPL